LTPMSIARDLKNLRDTLCQEDIDRLLNKFVTGATVGGERSHDRMHRLGRQWTYLAEYTPLEEELARISRVTLDELRAVCDEFPIRPITIGRLTPE